MRIVQLVILLVFSALVSLNAQSKEELKYWGLKGGLNLPFIVEEANPEFDLNMSVAWHAGAFKNIPISNYFAARVELLYTVKGGKDRPADFFLNVLRPFTIYTQYVSMPLIFQGNIDRFFGEIGFEPGLQVAVSTNNENTAFDNDVITETWTSNYDMNLVFGIGITDSDFEVNLRYLPGLVNVSNEITVLDSQGNVRTERFGRNNVFQLSLAYRIYNRK